MSRPINLQRIDFQISSINKNNITDFESNFLLNLRKIITIQVGEYSQVNVGTSMMEISVN